VGTVLALPCGVQKTLLAFLALSLALSGCAHEPSIAKPVEAPDIEAFRRGRAAPIDEDVRGLPGAAAAWFEAADESQRIYVLEVGPKRKAQPPLVLLHGVGQRGIRDYFPVLGALAEERHVIAMDLPGFGHSARGRGELTPEHMVEQVASVLWAMDVQKADVLGHSSGSALALLLAAKSPKLVRRQVLLGVCGVLRPETMLRSQLHEALNDAREKRPVGAKIAEKSGAALVNAMAVMFPSAGALGDTRLAERRPGVELAAKLLDYNFGPAIAAVRAPTLLVWGKDDEVAPVRIGHLLEDRLADARLEFLDGAGHVPMDDQPREIVEQVRAFLDEPLARKPAGPAGPFAEVVRCDDEANVTISGTYDEVLIDGCKQAWLNRVRARRVVVRDSDLRIDHTDIREGLVADDTRLVITGGKIRGDIALDLHGGHHDLAGVVIEGRDAALRARAPTEVLFSVTSLQSPHTRRTLHEERELEAGQEL
jgi:pimeloyl-ACP methyl ester carboxylesterase